MKKLLCYLYFVSYVCSGVAQDSTQVKSFYSAENHTLLRSITQVQPVHYRLNYESFFVNYAFNDTSAALVNLFFSKKQNTRWGFLGMDAGLLVLALAGSTQEEVCITTPSLGSCLAEKKRVYQPWVTPVVLVGMGGALTYVIIRLSTFSRQKLLHLLKDYADGKPIPPGIKKHLVQKYFSVQQ